MEFAVKNRMILMVLGFGLGLFVYAGYWIWVALEAEHSYQMNLHATVIVAEYIRLNEHWPKSWEALLTVPPTQGVGPSRENLELWKQFVTIEFTAELCQVASLSDEAQFPIHPRRKGQATPNAGRNLIVDMARKACKNSSSHQP